jgi:hypothetical protein
MKEIAEEEKITVMSSLNMLQRIFRESGWRCGGRCYSSIEARINKDHAFGVALLKLNPSPPHAIAGILEQSMGAGNRVGIGFSYRPARLYRLAELILWNRFLDSLKVVKYRLS